MHGIGVDDPLVWYEGTGTSNKRYLIADERGSIIAETSNSGSLITTHQYGPFGEPVDSSTARFRYTGQILLPGTELYHYKARVYHPELGRFLQTDPLGYQDGMNWYAYVQNNPYKYVDPDGRETLAVFQMEQWQNSYQNGDITRSQYVSGELARAGGLLLLR